MTQIHETQIFISYVPVLPEPCVFESLSIRNITLQDAFGSGRIYAFGSFLNVTIVGIRCGDKPVELIERYVATEGDDYSYKVKLTSQEPDTLTLIQDDLEDEMYKQRCEFINALAHGVSRSPSKARRDWRAVIGRSTGDAIMEGISEATLRVRVADRNS